MRTRWAVALLLVSLLVGSSACQHAASALAAPKARSVVVVVLDGFRPDYVSRENTPNIFTLSQDGTVCKHHHAAFPSVTRVNSATIATGCYPGHHGLLGNKVYFPAINPTKGLSAADANNLLDIEKATGGHLLTVPSLGERLQAAGKTMFVASSGSSGSAMLVNHKFAGGGVANVELIRPDSLRQRVESVIGPAPAEAAPNFAQNRWAVDAYLKVALPELAPDLTLFWLSDPDHTAHGAGVGAPKSMESIKAVDAEVGRIVKALRDRGLDRSTDLFVMSDHGFSTNTGGESISNLLVKAKLKESADSQDVVTVEGAIYVQNHDRDRIGDIVRVLQASPKMGAIFTHASAPGSPVGIAPGTLSLELIHFDHDRAPDILVSEDWSDAKNDFGYPGTAANNGTAGHGSSSPYDIHATLIATGPDIRSSATNELPTGQIDLAPTICHLLGIAPAEGMDGRVLGEILRNGGKPETPGAVEIVQRASTPEGDYHIEAVISRVGHTDYLDYARATR